MKLKKLWLFIGVSFIAGFIWGGVIKDLLPYQYLHPEIPSGKYERMATVDIIQNRDDIWIVEHKTGHLIFSRQSFNIRRDPASAGEYHRFKEVDKEAFNLNNAGKGNIWD